MPDLEIKHYMRRGRSDQDKILVVERVSAESETAKFLNALEEKRKVRACHWSIDMRGKVPGECSNYLINNKVFYLDSVSYNIFQKGLKENNGVFTQGTYDAIVNGEHTNKAIRAAQLRQQQARSDAPEGARAIAAEPGAGAGDQPAARRAATGPDYQPDILDFGYFKRRREPRLQYVTGVNIVAGELSYSAKTRDLSPSGLQVYIKGFCTLQKGDAVSLTFTEFDAEDPNGILGDIPYTVLDLEQKPGDFTLRLKRNDDENAEKVQDKLTRLTQRLAQRYKFDVEDDIHSLTSQLYERMYTDNLAHMPLFICRGADGGLYLDKIASTERNRDLVDYFEVEPHLYDFSALCLPQRLERLAALAAGKGRSASSWVGDSEMLLILFKQDDGNDTRIFSAADFEFGSPEEQIDFIRFAMVHDDHLIVKVRVRPANHPREEKFIARAERLREKSADDMELLHGDVERLVCVAMLCDVTGPVIESINKLEYAEGGSQCLDQVTCWVGGEKRRLISGEVVETMAELPVEPEEIRFGYLERRREERYLLETGVGISAGGKTLSGKTRDLSTRGLCVLVESDIPQNIELDMAVMVNFIKLQQMISTVKLTEVEYRIAGIVRGDEPKLMLERVVDRRQEKLNAFFVDLISRNRHKLPVDLNETLYAAKSRVYEGILSENLMNIPFFLARREDGGIMVRCLGLNETPAELSGVFMRKGKYDFSPLLDVRRVAYLYDGITLLSRQEAKEKVTKAAFNMDLYLVWRDGDDGQLLTASDADLGGGEARNRFIDTAMNSGRCRFLKIAVTPVNPLNEHELDGLLDGIREQSRHRAFQLKDDIRGIIGQGEIIDITEQVSLAYRLGRVKLED